MGQTISSTYEIVGVLGSGAMGTVYDARDLALPRHVAVKVMNAPVHEPFLRREAQALAAIRHPGFVTLHHLGVHDGTPFMVMERLVGETLEARLVERAKNGGQFSTEEATEVLIALAEALSAAHRAGVVHRDLKPANVIFSDARVVLFDTGLFVPDVVVLATDDVNGTPEYIAPEAILGRVKKGQGHLLDLYALGVIAFELLTNAPPYADGSIASVLASHVSADIPDIREVRDVPQGLAKLITELLAKNPEDRPGSAEAVLWELKHSHRMGSLPPPSFGPPPSMIPGTRRPPFPSGSDG